FSVWPVLRKFIQQSDAIICVSRAQRDLLVKRDPSFKEKIRIIYNPLPNLSPVPINGDDFGYFGGQSYLKGFYVLLKALLFMKSRGFKPVTMHGTKFSSLIESSAYFESFGFNVYGKLNISEYESVYRKIKAVIVPSIWHEPFGYVVAEAILRDKVVIASNIGGIPELVYGCKGVFLFDAGDSMQLAERMRYVSGLSRESVTDLCEGNRELFLRRFSNREILQNFIGLCYNMTIDDHYIQKFDFRKESTRNLDKNAA
ncbi:MAG: glycosyltransferase, partial [Candidatus Bathyarchaeia archaeon]